MMLILIEHNTLTHNIKNVLLENIPLSLWTSEGVTFAPFISIVLCI